MENRGQQNVYPQGDYPKQDGYSQGAYPQGGYPQGDYPKQDVYSQFGYSQSGYPPPSPGPNPAEYGRYGETSKDGIVVQDVEMVKGFDFNDQSIRKSFIRKVYSILMCQLLVTCGFISLFIFHKGTKLWVFRNPFTLWIALGLVFVFLIVMTCCTNVCRKVPTNFICLGIFTVAESFLLGFISSRYETDVVLMAIGTTAAVCFALTIFAMQTKYDFTVMGGFLVVALITLLVFGIVAAIFPGKVMILLYSSAGVLIFSLYLIYDTQLMMGGNHKYSISPEEYTFAALSLYLDIINIFLYILRIMSASK